MQLEVALLLAINGLRRPWLDPIVQIGSDYAVHGLLLYPLVAMASRWRSDRARAVDLFRDVWLASLGVLFVAESVLKPIIARPRPTSVVAIREALHVLGTVPPASSTGFPSGTAAAVFGAAWLIRRRESRSVGLVVLVLAAFASLGRLYIGVHYPTDVLAGALLGIAVAEGVERLRRGDVRESRR